MMKLKPHSLPGAIRLRQARRDGQFFLQLLDLAVQRLDLAILGIMLGRRTGPLRPQAVTATLGQLHAPVAQLRVVDGFLAQQGTQLAMCARIGCRKDALLLGGAEPAPALRAWRTDFHG